MDRITTVARVANIECNLHPGIKGTDDLRDEIDRLIGLCNGDTVDIIEVTETGHLDKIRFCEGRQEVFRLDAREERLVSTYRFKKLHRTGSYELILQD